MFAFGTTHPDLPRVWRFVSLVVAALWTGTGAGFAADESVIWVEPPGLVTGEARVTAKLATDSGPAELFLDGEAVCIVTAAHPECTVDLGEALRVHLLELTSAADGGRRLLGERWLNRPGREADLAIQLAKRPIGNLCGGRLRWSGFGAADPVRLWAQAAGQRLSVASHDQSFAYYCADPGETEVVSATVEFADGRRAWGALITDDAGRPTGRAVEPTVLESLGRGGDPCEGAESRSSTGPRADLYQGLEVAFVLDPGADYRTLAGLSTPSTVAGASWQDISTAFSQLDWMWFVSPDDSLARVDGFDQGHDNWFGLLLERGLRAPQGRIRIADGVATAGLALGGAPNRRAVVLVLGDGAGRDQGQFTPDVVRSYLSEIGVPLIVIRTGGGATDGWPTGTRVRSISELAAALDDVRRNLDRQCVAWFEAGLIPEQIVSLLPSELKIAGRAAVGASETVWRRAAIAGGLSQDRPISDQPVASERVEVTAVSVLVRTIDAEGRPVTDLAPGELVVLEDGHRAPVLAVEPLPGVRTDETAMESATASQIASAPARKVVPVAIYVERRLAGMADLAPTLRELSERADWLTRLGPVDIVVADQAIEIALEGSTDPVAVRQILEDLAKLPSTQHEIERIRTNYVRYIREYPERGRATDSDGSSAVPYNLLRVKTMSVARRAIFEEDALLTSTMERMNDWALDLPETGPRLLFLVGTGFDEDPIDFYMYFLQQKDPSLAPAARAEFLRYNQATRVETVGRELAAAGWLVVPVATRVSGTMRTSAEFGGGEKFQAFLTDSEQEGAYLRDVDFMLLDPLGSQRHLAEPSGGKVVIGGRGLDRLIEESSGWYRLTYQVDRAPDGALHEVEIATTRRGLEVESTDVVVSGTSEGRAAKRLRVLLDDPAATGELSVRIALGAPSASEEGQTVAEMSVIVDFGPIAPLFADDGRRAIRFSIAVRGEGGGTSVHHQLATAVGAVPGFRYNVPVSWRKKDPSRVAVVVEDLGSGAWGGTIAELAE